MSLFDSFLNPKRSLQGLNLQVPDSPSATTAEHAGPVSPCQIDPELARIAGPIIEERANAMFEAGERPRSFYLAIDTVQGGLVAFKLNGELRSAALVFTSGFQAFDYLRASGMPGEVQEIPATVLQSHMKDWLEAGAGAIALDRCPRCPICLAIPIRGYLTDEQVGRVWAIHRSARIFQVQRYLRAWLGDRPVSGSGDEVVDRVEKRKILEMIRDHLDCSVPYLHWMIALEAGVSRNEEVRLAAVKRLQEFGPQFSDRVTSSSEGDGWSAALSECHVGLLASYDMLRPLHQEP